MWQNFLNRFLPSDKVFLYLLLSSSYSALYSIRVLLQYTRTHTEMTATQNHIVLIFPDFRLCLHKSKLQKLIFICAAAWLFNCVCIDKVYLTRVCVECCKMFKKEKERERGTEIEIERVEAFKAKAPHIILNYGHAHIYS